MTNFEVIMKEHPQFVKECLAHTRVQGVLQAVVEGKHEHDSWYDKEEDRDEMNFLNAEYVQPVLDNVEKKYLSDVIRPFRNKIKFIKKTKMGCFYYIVIRINGETMTLPNFSSKSKMYEGMKLDKAYTLEDLGL